MFYYFSEIKSIINNLKTSYEKKILDSEATIPSSL
mgnify:CR=1 FL=1